MDRDLKYVNMDLEASCNCILCHGQANSFGFRKSFRRIGHADMQTLLYINLYFF